MPTVTVVRGSSWADRFRQYRIECDGVRVGSLERDVSGVRAITVEPRCPDARLGELSPGRYAVLYASPDGSEHALGSIEVPRP